MVSDGIDLFSGARGWEARAHRSLGLDLLGIEWWEPANRTSRAAGLRTLQADIATLNPADHAGELAATGARLLVGSPPCQGRSMAGKRLGAQDVQRTTQCMTDLADGHDTRAEHAAACADPRSILTVEPLRWALALRPRVVLLEQVPAVLPDWQHVGSLLERFGYSWWAGVLEAERFGVPQTRERAILIARNDGHAAHPPEPTHHRFVPNEPRPQDEHGLFGEIKSWVSMAEALGWDDGPSPSPSPTVSAGGTASGGGVEVFASRESRGGHDTANRVWTTQRPATAVGDARITAPHAGSKGDSQSKGAIRVTVEEAAALQSFPPDWPWAGDGEKPNTRTAQFTMVGNAVPPLLGECVLRTVLAAERWAGSPPT